MSAYTYVHQCGWLSAAGRAADAQAFVSWHPIQVIRRSQGKRARYLTTTKAGQFIPQSRVIRAILQLSGLLGNDCSGCPAKTIPALDAMLVFKHGAAEERQADLDAWLAESPAARAAGPQMQVAGCLIC